MNSSRIKHSWSFVSALLILCSAMTAAEPQFFENHCYECHDAQTQEGGLDLKSLSRDLSKAENFDRWVRIYDRVIAGEMPPMDA